jgi:hypothetical protein
LLQPMTAAGTPNEPRRSAGQSYMIRRTGIVREIGISLRIRIANVLNVSGGKAERLATDGRCLREWDGVLSGVRLGSRNVGVFAHNDEARSGLQR